MKVIDRCLSDRNRWYTTAQIFERCNNELADKDFQKITAMNSIRDDIRQIERLYPKAVVEKKKEGRNVYYHYQDPTFSIFNTPLKPEELIQLTQTLKLLNRFKGMPQFDWITELAERLGTTLKVGDLNTKEIVGFDENMDLVGLDNFTPLFNAITDERVLKLAYKSFNQKTESEIIVHPYYLKQYNKRWFLIAWNQEHDFLANYALDRILSIKELDLPYRYANINFLDYFDEMVGVSKDTRTSQQLVKIWVSPVSWPYIKTKPLHGTQKIISEDDTGAVITIEVYLNYELEQMLMSFGENIKVLEPKEFREHIKQRLVGAAMNYSEQVQFD